MSNKLTVEDARRLEFLHRHGFTIVVRIDELVDSPVHVIYPKKGKSNQWAFNSDLQYGRELVGKIAPEQITVLKPAIDEWPHTRQVLPERVVDGIQLAAKEVERWLNSVRRS